VTKKREENIIGDKKERIRHTTPEFLAEKTKYYRDKYKFQIHGINAQAFTDYYNLGVKHSHIPAAGTSYFDSLNTSQQKLVTDICGAGKGGSFDTANPTDQKALKDGIAQALQRSGPTPTDPVDPITKVHREVEALTKLIKDPDRKFANEDIAENLQAKLKAGAEAIELQHKQETTKIIDLFNKAPLAGNIPLQEETLKNLKAAQAEQLTKFKSEIEKSIKVLNNVRNDYYNVEAIESHRQVGDKQMRDAINAAITARVPPGMSYMGPSSISVEGLKLRELREEKDKNNRLFHTFGGRNVKIESKGGKEVYSMDGENRWLSFHNKYFFDRESALSADWTNIALALKADGHKNVTINADCTYEPKALKIARLQFEGACRAGFSPENIKINVNGKTLSKDDIFKGPHQSDLKRCIAAYEKRLAHDNEVVGPPPRGDKTVQAEIDKAVQEEVASKYGAGLGAGLGI
jgi:hypothetical protein